MFTRLFGPEPPQRPLLIDLLILLLGVALSHLLITVIAPTPEAAPTDGVVSVRAFGNLQLELSSPSPEPIVQACVLALPDLLRMHEGIVLLWPLFLIVQRLRDRPPSLMAGEWLWMLLWLGTIAVNSLAAWERWGVVPPFVEDFKTWPIGIWYGAGVPLLAVLALLCAFFTTIRVNYHPWTNGLGLALALWPVLPLAGIVMLGKIQ